MRASYTALLATVIATAFPSALLLSCDSESTEVDGAGGGATELLCAPGETRSCYEGPAATEDVGACVGGAQSCLQHGQGWGACVGQVLPEQEICDEPPDENCDGLTSCGQTIWAHRAGVERDEAVYRVNADSAGNLYMIGFYRGAELDLGGGELPTTDNSLDVLVAKYDNDGEHVWSVGMHGTSTLQPRDIAVSEDGESVVIVANVYNEIFVDGTSIPSNGDADILIVKLDGDGNVIWTRRLGDDEAQVPIAVALNESGDVHLAGYFRGEIDFGGETPLSSAGFNLDAFVAKLDSSGEEVWSRVFNGPLDQVPRDLTVGPDGGVFVTGRISGSVDFGGGELSATGELPDAFLLGLTEAGEHKFSRTWGGEGYDEGWGVAADSSGNVIITGRFQEQVRFGASLFDAVGAGAIFVTKVDQDGSQLWAERIGGASEQSATDIVVDTRDRIIIAGYYEGEVAFGNAKLPPSGVREPNILVAKLEPNGEPVWARGIAVDGNQDAAGVARGWRCLALLPGDFIAVGGFAEREIDFGEGPLEAFGDIDLLFAKLAP